MSKLHVHLIGTTVGIVMPVVVTGSFIALVGCCSSSTPTKKDASNDPFEEGRVAGRAGLSKEHNPYQDRRIGTDASHAEKDEAKNRQRWLSGYNTGLAEEKDIKLIRTPPLP